ncbi:efflux RND transporter permease subunit, partial [Thermodesulfobacteriota bacterium]
GEPGTFTTAEAWAKVSSLEKRLRQIPEVSSTDSLLHVLEYLYETISASKPLGDLYTDSRIVSEMLMLTSLSPEGKRLRARFVDESRSKNRIKVRIVNSPDVPIADTIAQVRKAAEDEMAGLGEIYVTGDLAVFAAQAARLVRAQTLSLFMAVSCITILMIIQFRSIALGLLSLIPNLVPLVVIFGLMGWCGISLDSVTVFAATVSIGLSVDDTIHYLTQLKRETHSASPDQGIEPCLVAAYQVTAKALISTSAVLFFGFLMLVISPFRPVIFFGVLGSAAVMTALAADLVFLPSVILSVPFMKRIVLREMRS